MTSGRLDPQTVAIVFFTHVFDETALAHLEKLREESADFGTFFVYSDIHGGTPPEPGLDVVRFDFEAIRCRYPSVLGQTLVPGNCHLAFLDFYRQHPEFNQYWLIEYDVMLVGHWQDFFGAFADLQADFLATHLRLQEEEPQWYWWNTLDAPAAQTLPSVLVRAFCPVQRMSRRALELLETKAAQGWGGHFECLVPSLLRSCGYSLADIGGNGRFVPRGFRNRFYTSFSWRDGSLLHFGSMRFRPELSPRHVISRLYHPVKGPAALSQSLVNLGAKLNYVARNLAAFPMSFGRALLRHYLS